MQIGVFEDSITTLSEELEGTASLIRDRIFELNASLDFLALDWTGTASQAFVADRRQWTAASSALSDVLMQMSAMLRYTRERYADAEAANAQTLGGASDAGGFVVVLDKLTGYATALQAQNETAGGDASSLYSVYNQVAGNPLAFPTDDQWHSVSDLLVKLNEGLAQAVYGVDLLTRALVQVEQNYTATEGQLSTMYSKGWSQLFFNFTPPTTQPLPGSP